jgi:glycosyltransferase involved in cell wall biosynthesis
MNICFLAGTLGRGGAERQLLYMLEALQRTGVNTRLLTLTAGEAFENEISDLGVDIEWVGQSENRVARLRRIIRSIQDRPADIIQSSHFYTNLYAAVAGRVRGIKSIGAIRSNFTNEMRSNPIFGRLHLRLPDHLIVNSQPALERALANGISESNIDLVPNAVSYPDLSLSTTERPGSAVRMLFVGRLVPEKRPQLFVRMAAQLKRVVTEVPIFFTMVGGGPLRPEVEREAEMNELGPDSLAILGERSDLDRIYRENDILVLTSDFEGTPNVILEAMSYGLAVVATRVGGVPDIVSSETGWLVDPSDLSGLAEATATLIRNRSFRSAIGRGARRYISENRSVSSLGDQLNEVYRKVLPTQ